MFDDGDPRVSGDFVRAISGGSGGDVVLVGVVHDHPASTFRVRAAIEAHDPDVLALELPPLALPIYERYADDRRTPPVLGGEMSAAIQAAAADEVVGIDGPSLGFLGRLGGELHREGVSADTLRSVFRSLRSVTARAVECRAAAVLASVTGSPRQVGEPVTHDCDWNDDPAAQADDERAQVRRARAVADVFGTSEAARVRDAAREAHMADRLAALREDGPVLAVVGIDHLDPVAERLSGGRGSDCS